MKSVASVISGLAVLMAAVAGPGVGGPAFAADAPKAGTTSSKGKAKAAAAPAPAPAPARPAFALEPDGVNFGMNVEGVARLYDAWWDKQFVPKYRKANPGPKTRELDYELAEKKKVLRRVTNFEGRSSFDKADFSEEFAHGNGETMTSAKLFRRAASAPAAGGLAGPGPAVPPVGEGGEPKVVAYTRRFFFFQDRLWKIYDEYKLDSQSPIGPEFKDAAARVESSLGQGTKKTRGPDSAFENVVFENGGTRVRVVKLPSNRVAVVRSDDALAREVLDSRSHQAQAQENELDEDIQAVIR
jgi:hypothetical protein